MSEEHPSSGGLLKSKTGLALLVFGAIAAFFLITEHQAHLWGWLPYLLLLACSPMHIFMHRGHGGHGGHSRQDVARSAVKSDSESGGNEARHPEQEKRDQS
ncbi:MAG: hypothetical protein A3G26_06180 [Betaproteobacteria bacterium RIFCSPLOWO2_12_FULL_65_110]|nr:MAG: hypothetical protein A3G26_06180 [Betaproteobacteria bacterium RIFCSPLOWO2_12_FULL_65_110]